MLVLSMSVKKEGLFCFWDGVSNCALCYLFTHYSVRFLAKSGIGIRGSIHLPELPPFLHTVKSVILSYWQKKILHKQCNECSDMLPFSMSHLFLRLDQLLLTLLFELFFNMIILSYETYFLIKRLDISNIYYNVFKIKCHLAQVENTVLKQLFLDKL